MRALVHKPSKATRELAGQTGGNVSIFTAIAALPLLLAAGAAIDYTRAARVETELQAAADSAALAAATFETNDVAKQKAVGATYFQSNFEDTALSSIVPTITVDGDKVTVTASFDYPMTFMALAGISTMPITAISEVQGGKGFNAEVALVLDYSGSMLDSNKYVRMRDAAIKLTEELTASKKYTTIKFGIVPFSAMVRTSMSASYVIQPAATATWTGCTQDRLSPYNTEVSTPTANDDTKWGYIDDHKNENGGKYDCTFYLANKLDITPLTADAAAIKARLAEMYPLGNTNIPLGAEFGWNLLDPDAPFIEGAPYSDKKTRKFVLLLTDGVQTSRHWGDKGNRSVDNGNDNLVTVCKKMAAKGITIFAIAYDIKAEAVTKLLKACAPDNYFEPDTSGTQIDAVFAAITERIKKSTMHITK